MRFNRYIVECKCVRKCCGRQFPVGFNRYIVECKFAKNDNIVCGYL